MRPNDRNHAWIVVALLFIFMVINFADKAVIGIAAVPIMQELELGPRQFGLVGSSFFLLFAVSSVATGFLVNRVQTRWVPLAMGSPCKTRSRKPSGRATCRLPVAGCLKSVRGSALNLSSYGCEVEQLVALEPSREL